MVVQVTMKPITTVATPIRPIRKNEEQVPKFFCKTCGSCDNNYCDVFKRHVDADYNRCFNHTNYPSRRISFKAPANLDEIIQNEEKANAELFK